MPDGTMSEIEHLSVGTAKETLGVFTCPSGFVGAQLLSMKKKGSGMDRPSKGEPPHEKGHLVLAGLSAVAEARVRHKLCLRTMEDAVRLLEKNLVATHSNGRNNQVRAERGAPDEQGLLWRRLPTSRSRVLCPADQ